jgi:hypothetical protein
MPGSRLCVVGLDALGRLLVVDASGRRGVDLGELVVLFGAVKALLEDGLGLVHIELGLEAVDVRGHGAAVGAAPSIGKVEVAVVGLVAWRSPVSTRQISWCSPTYQTDEMQLARVRCMQMTSAGCMGKNLPVASATAVLLGLLGINAGKAILAKELGNNVLRQGSAGGNGSMGAVVELVGAGHFDGLGPSRKWMR